MAKLKARGRIELFRVEKEGDVVPKNPGDVIWRKDSRALMSDGNILERSSAKWPDKYEPSGVRRHDWAWKVRGKLKAGWTPQKLLDLYLGKGFVLKSKVSHLVAGPLFDEPLITEAKAASAARAKVKSAEKRKVVTATRSGPGFYVTNVYTAGGDWKPRIADHEKPFASFEEAEEAAIKRLRHLGSFGFTYLLPVQVIEAPSRTMAEQGIGHVWWTNGKFKGGPIDPRQLRFAGVNGR